MKYSLIATDTRTGEQWIHSYDSHDIAWHEYQDAQYRDAFVAINFMKYEIKEEVSHEQGGNADRICNSIQEPTL